MRNPRLPSNLITDEIERELINQEIRSQLSFSPAFDLKALRRKLASLFSDKRHNDDFANEPVTAR